jgi:RimJ/RimL family protein N-acetyltransferase
MSFTLIEFIETPRLVLRCPYPRDAEALHAAVVDSLALLRQWPDSLPWAQNPQTLEGAHDYCQSSYGAFVFGLAWPMLMLDKLTNALIGTVGFHRMDPTKPEFELGYWCRTAYQGRGLTSEAVAALSDQALLNWPTVRLVCRVDVRNAASCRVVEKAQYRFKLLQQEASTSASPTMAVRVYERWSAAHTEQAV